MTIVERLYFSLAPGGPQRAELEKGFDIVFGSDASVSPLVNSPGMAATHARLTDTGTAFVLTDLGSGTGTSVNGRHRHVNGGTPWRHNPVRRRCGGPGPSRLRGDGEPRPRPEQPIDEARGPSRTRAGTM